MKLIWLLHQAEVVVDSAFKLRKHPFLIKSSQVVPKLPEGSTCKEEQRACVVNDQAASVRQLSEHGMRMIQGQFPRLKDNLICEEFGERRIVLHLMVLLYNYQTSKVGINQILNTFMSRTRGFKNYGFTYKNDATKLQLISLDANDCFQ